MSEKMLEVIVDTVLGAVEHRVLNTKVDASGVLAVGDGKETHLYSPGAWLHARVTEVEVEDSEEEPKDA